MNVKKAVKRLNRAETLVTRVLDQFGKKHPHAEGLLRTAQESLHRAKAAIGVPAESGGAKRVAAKAAPEKSPRQAGPAKKQETPAAKKLSSQGKRPRSKGAARRKPTARRPGSKKAEQRVAPAQPAPKKQVATRKAKPAAAKRPGQTAKPAAAKTPRASRPRPLPAPIPAETQPAQPTEVADSAPRVIDGPGEFRRY